MRGDDPRHDGMFSDITPEARVRPDHPLRPIRQMTDAALGRLSSRFDRLYSTTGRPSIPPEKLLRALLLQLLTENRHGLIVDTAASGTAERDAAIARLGELPLTTRRPTVAVDTAYAIRTWVTAVRRMRITPHVAQNEFGYGGSAIDARTTRHAGYRPSHRKRKLMEQACGWLTTVALLRTLRHRGGRLVDGIFTFGAAAYNLVRWRNLIAQRA